VKKIMPSRNEIMVARRESLYSKMVEAKNFNWMTNRIPEEVNCHAQIRYRHKAAFGLLEVKSPGHVAFTFDRPQWAVTPGQALVCYDGDRLIGGGWISS
jgi:tRNA-specific 2-thiouridylase